MSAFFWVFLGGGLGSICRYLLALVLKDLSGNYPLATWAANIISCFILGALWVWALKNSAGDSFKLLWMTGFCGGFSTFSTFTLETITLLQKGESTLALTNIVLSILVCAVSLWLGMRAFS